MAHLTKLSVMLAAGIFGLASAQSQSALVTQIFFPLADIQPLDASIIAQSPGATTILMNCAPGTPSDECGFPEPITLTVGPSTLHYNPTGIYEIFGNIDCKITASATADCTAVAGLYTDVADASGTVESYITTPAASSSTSSAILNGTDVSWLDITITAGLDKAAATATTTGAGTSSGSSGVSGSQSGSGTSAASASSASRTGTSSGTSSAGVASATSNIAASSFKVGYTGLGVAAVLVGGSMILL